MNKKGQALVEFIIILPIFIFMVLAVIDIGKMLYSRNLMQEELDEVVSMYNDGKKYSQINDYIKDIDKDLSLEISNDNNEYIEFKLKLKPEINTPGLNLIITRDIEAKRVIYYDE